MPDTIDFAAQLVAGVTPGGGRTATTLAAYLDNNKVADVLDFAPVGVTITDGAGDATSAFLLAAGVGRYIRAPQGRYKTTAATPLLGGAHVIGDGPGLTSIEAWGCDAFTIASPGGDHITVEKMQLFSLSAVGAVDPRTHVAVKAVGTAANHVNYLKVAHCYLRGWSRGVDWQYTWNSGIDDVTTINTTTGVRLFGQSVNNAISNSSLVVNGGTASIDAVVNGADSGEGLMVTNTLLASGTYGARTTDFLSLSLVGCTVDLIGDTAVLVTNCRNLKISASWLYAVNYGVRFVALGSSSVQKASLFGNDITTTASAGRGVMVENNNVGVSVLGGNIDCGATGYCVYADGVDVSVLGVHLTNPSANPSVLFAGTGKYTFLGCTGNASVSYTNNVPTRVPGLILDRRIGVAWSATPLIDASKANHFTLPVVSGIAAQIQAPTNLPTDAAESWTMTLEIQNASGGAMGALTFAAIYRLGAAWVSPANGFNRSITFKYDKTANAMKEVGRSIGDCAN